MSRQLRGTRNELMRSSQTYATLQPFPVDLIQRIPRSAAIIRGLD
jgi:hypothetical protein